MSCVAAKVYHGSGIVMMASDGLATWGDDEGSDCGSKLFRLGPMIIGFIGPPRAAQILKNEVEVTAVPKGRSHAEYLYELVNVFRDVARERMFLKDNGSDVTETGCCFLVGLKNKIYTIDGCFAVTDVVDDYTAIGSGGTYALGALHYDASPEDAVNAAVYHCNSVGGTIHTMKGTK